MKPRILHLSADYPDSLDRSKTSAIQGLVDGTRDQFDHFVISLNRRGRSWSYLAGGKVIDTARQDGLLACRYAAPPAAIAVDGVMRRLAVELAAELDLADYRPDLVQGHKLTIEGFLAKHLSALLGVPYALTVQGNTDQKLIRQRPDRLAATRRIWHGASGIMTFAPWSKQWCSQRLGQPARPVQVIPCLIPHDAILAPVAAPQLIRTAFNLDFWRNKNVATLIAAIAHLIQSGRALGLEIAGGGSPEARLAIEGMIAEAKLQEYIALVGPIAPEQIQDWFNGAALFALPSLRESFGMVFAEALLAGTPVIHPRGAAIDGYLPNAAFARSVAASDALELADAIADLLDRNAAIKANLAAAQSTTALKRFQREAVLGDYGVFLRGALA